MQTETERYRQRLRKSTNRQDQNKMIPCSFCYVRIPKRRKKTELLAGSFNQAQKKDGNTWFNAQSVPTKRKKNTLGGITDELWAQLIPTAWLIHIMCSSSSLQLCLRLAYVVWLNMPGKGRKTSTQKFVYLLRNWLHTDILKSLSMLSWPVTGIHSLFKQ